MLKRIALILTVCCPLAAFGSEGAHPAFWKEPSINVHDKASLQRGARMFANYCMGCHQAKYQRWMHVADDLGIPDDVLQNNLIWTTGPKGKKERVGMLMTNAMTDEYASNAFGKVPPDLTLVARYREPAWIYNYLQAFYIDSSSKTGVNNALLKGASMPDVLWSLQGLQRAKFEKVDNEKQVVGFDQVQKGSMSPKQFQRSVNDLVNFLAYLGEPAQLDRAVVGKWVILFLVILLVLAYALKKEYWKDVH